MWDLIENEYIESHKMGMAILHSEEKMKTGMVMYMNTGYSVLLFYHEYDTNFLSDEDKHEIEATIKNKFGFSED